jgi:hypothetical protein
MTPTMHSTRIAIRSASGEQRQTLRAEHAERQRSAASQLIEGERRGGGLRLRNMRLASQIGRGGQKAQGPPGDCGSPYCFRPRRNPSVVVIRDPTGALLPAGPCRPRGFWLLRAWGGWPREGRLSLAHGGTGPRLDVCDAGSDAPELGWCAAQVTCALSGGLRTLPVEYLAGLSQVQGMWQSTRATRRASHRVNREVQSPQVPAMPPALSPPGEEA